MVGSVFRYGVAQAVRTALPLSGGARNAKGIGAAIRRLATQRPTRFAKKGSPDFRFDIKRSREFGALEV